VARRCGIAVDPEIPGLYRFGDTRHIFSDVAKLKALGWRPTVTLEEIVDAYIAWAQAQPGFRDYSAEAAARMSALGALRKAT
jgi:dTDP-L-rhamnose 4-epimerase